jgi:YHS domain-containing protein
VIVLPHTPHLLIDNVDYWFCNPACRDTFAAKTAS